MTCIHTTAGLCPACQRDRAEDPLAFAEYGPHPDGIRRTRELAEELAARPPALPTDTATWPL